MVSNSITVSERDMRRLSTLLDTSLTYRYPVESARLGEVLAQASVSPDENVPAVVTMGATIFCTDAFGRTRELSLVYPWDADPFAGYVSVLSPIGIALLGLRPGQTVEYGDEEGAVHSLTVVDVVPSFSKAI